ncbi:DedA family protein [Frateuria edaphi]|jgi:membrane protein DedA with SNARE-associated domain|uniref:DedA family protein n=1 Tax=Frateuria edaphi TaxID=2898793 RepID=UPI001E4D2FAF|nr:DedA family protein [Frateuria edaphi]UGB45311.1 DedA family protein [Frateuria edaphi]
MALLERLIVLFAESGYLAVFAALLLCGAGAPLPEDITLVAGGVIAGLGFANVHVMALVSLVGVLVGDAAMFLLGHRHGARIMQWPLVARLLTPQRYARVQEKFARYGNRLLFLARFLPGMRTAVYVTAGATHRVSFLRFFLLDGLAALISVPVWVYLGYFGANNREWLAMWIGRGQHGIWILAALLVIAGIVLWWRHRWRARRGMDD